MRNQCLQAECVLYRYEISEPKGEEKWSVFLNYGEYEVFSEAAASCTASVMERGGTGRHGVLFPVGLCFGKGSAVEIRYSFPILDICGRWHPNCRADRALKADWERRRRP